MVTDSRIETQAPTNVQTDHESEQETRQRLEQWQAVTAANLAGGFTQVPDAVRRDPTLSTSAKLVYEHLLGYCWGKDYCYPSQERIAQELGISRRTVIRACNELYERGHVEKWRRGLGYTNYWFVNPLSFVYATSTGQDAKVTRINLQRPADAPLEADSPLAPLYGVTFYASDPIFSVKPEVTNLHNGCDNVAPQEAPNLHTKHTKVNPTKDESIDSKYSTAHKEGGRETEPPSVGTGTQPSQNQERKERKPTKDQERDQAETKRNAQPISRAQELSGQTAAAISQATGIAPEHLAELGIAPQPRRRPAPSFVEAIMKDYSRDLGDVASSTRSNVTRAAKLYYLMLDYGDDDFRYAPEEYFTRLLYICKEEALTCTNIKYRNGNRFNRIPAFFGCLENRLGLSAEEREFVRTDALLYEPQQ